MCWRDDVVRNRCCSRCGREYHGDLGHRGCPGPPLPGKQPGTKVAPEAIKPNKERPRKGRKDNGNPPF